MFRKVLIAIIIFLVLLAFYVRLFGGSASVQQPLANQQISTPAVSERIAAGVPQTKLRFTPEPLKLNPEGTVEAEIFLEPNENKVTAVHYEIGYDPKVFTFVSLKPVDLLGGKKITVNTVDKKTGK